MRRQCLVTNTYQGTNILGVCFLLMAGAIVLVGSRCVQANELGMQSFFVFSALGFPGLFDFVWRYNAGPQENWWRLFLANSGGTLHFVPAWVFFAVMSFSMLAVALLRDW